MSKIANKIWEDKEINILKENPHLPLKELQELMPTRTFNAIVTRRHYLKICSNKPKWTDFEIQILKNNFQKPMNALKKKLPNRSEQSIRTKIVYLGLKRIENKEAIRVERLFML